MWILTTCLSVLYISSVVAADSSAAGPSTEAAPPDLKPLITRANGLLATGQFGEAVKAYSEAIGEWDV
jgi:DnaJ family protein C protein 3